MTHLGPRRKAPTYFANQMMAQLLGGGFASRINMNLREDKGYAYGARAGFGYNRTFGAFTATSSVRTDATAQTLIEMVRETTGLKDGSMPPREPELAREKNGAILGLPGIFATASQTLGAYRGLVYFGLPLDYYASYAAKVGAVDLKAAAKAARRELRPERARFLIVGDGDAPQIQHDAAAKTNPPMLGPDGKPLTLRQALARLAGSGALGGAKLQVIELDADGRPRP
jgi:zinc protease